MCCYKRRAFYAWKYSIILQKPSSQWFSTPDSSHLLISPPGSSHLLHCLVDLCWVTPPALCLLQGSQTHSGTVQLWHWMNRQGGELSRWLSQSSSCTPKHSWQTQRHLHMQTCLEAPVEAPRDRLTGRHKPSLSDSLSRQTDGIKHSTPPLSLCCSGGTRAPTWSRLWSSHTSAGHELPSAAGWATPRGSSSSVGTDRSIALLASEDWAMQSLWSDTGRGKDEGKRTLWSKEKSVFLSSQGEGGQLSQWLRVWLCFFHYFGHCGTAQIELDFPIWYRATNNNEKLSLPGGGDSRLLVTSTVLNSRLCLLVWKGRKCLELLLGWYSSNLLGFFNSCKIYFQL